MHAGCGTGRLTATGNETAIPDDVAAAACRLTTGAWKAGPVQPGDEVRDELRAFLMADESRLGQVYRRREQGLDADVIAGKFEAGHPSFARNYRPLIRALVDGDLPSAPAVALAAARTCSR